MGKITVQGPGVFVEFFLSSELPIACLQLLLLLCLIKCMQPTGYDTIRLLKRNHLRVPSHTFYSQPLINLTFSRAHFASPSRRICLLSFQIHLPAVFRRPHLCYPNILLFILEVSRSIYEFRYIGQLGRIVWYRDWWPVKRLMKPTRIMCRNSYSRLRI